MWVEPIQIRRMHHWQRTFSTSWGSRTFTSYHHSSVTSSPYDNGVGGRIKLSIGHGSRVSSIFQGEFTSEPLSIVEPSPLRINKLFDSMLITLYKISKIVSKLNTMESNAKELLFVECA